MGEPVEVEVHEFARAFFPGETPPRVPGADIRKNGRGYFMRLDFDGIDEDDLTEIVAKARDNFEAVEVVEQVREADTVAKERRYVESVGEVPEGYEAQQGPMGGVFYETEGRDPAATDEVGYSGQPVLAVRFEDIEPGDRVAFERPESGERDMGEVIDTDESENRVTVRSGDGETDVVAAPLEGLEEKEDGGVTSSTPGVHSARYSDEDDEEDDIGIGGDVGKMDLAKAFEADVYRVTPTPEDADDFDGDVLGIAVDFPNHDVYVDWNNDVFPDQLDNAHVSIYGSVEDLEQATGNETELVDTHDLTKFDPIVNGHESGPLEDELYCEEHGASFEWGEVDDWSCPWCGEEVVPESLQKAAGADDAPAEGPSDEGEGVWVYYVGPKGGEGWQSVQTGEIRYQQERPGPAPEGGDGYDDWLAEGWMQPDEFEGEFEPGQPVEVEDPSGHYEAEVESYDPETGELEVSGEDIPMDNLTVGDYQTELSAVSEYDRHDEWFDDEELTADEYWAQVQDEVPEDAADEFQDWEVGETAMLDLPSEDEPVELPVYGYVNDDHPKFSDEGLVFHYDDIEEAVGEETMEDAWGPPGEASPTLSATPFHMEQMVSKPGGEDAEDSDDVAEDAVGEPVEDEPSDIDLPDGVDHADPEDFASAVEAFAEANPDLEDFLTMHSPEEFEDYDLFLSDAGDAGVAVNPDGDIQNVFSADDAVVDGDTVMEAAIAAGGETLDCYDGFLTDFYESHGFDVTGAMEFNPEFAPEGWDEHEYLEDQPDVVFMAHEAEVEDNEVPYYDGSEWDDAKTDSQRAAGAGADGGAEGGGVGAGESGTGPEAGETGGDDGVGGWSESWTADYDMTEYSPDDVVEWGGLSDFGFPSGVTAANMEVGALDSWDGESNEGLVFTTNYGPGDEKVDLGNRQMVTYTTAEIFGGNVPVHTGDPETDGYVAAEGVEGEDIGSAPDEYLEQVDEDEWFEQAAIQIICGNNDAHMQNVKVTPDGDLVFHDIDHSAGDITGDFVGNKPYYENAIDRVLGELSRSGQHVTDAPSSDDPDLKNRMLEAAEEKAQEIYDAWGDEQKEAMERAYEFDEELASNVWGNLMALRDGDVSWQ